MALLTKVKLDLTGVLAAPVAASASDTVVNDQPNAFIIITNIGGVSRTMTIDDPNSIAPANAVAFNPDVTVTIPAGAGRFVPLPGRFTNPATGLASWTYSDPAGLVLQVAYL